MNMPMEDNPNPLTREMVVPDSLSSEEMIAEIYSEMRRIRELLEDYKSLVMPTIESLMSNPMLKMFFGGNNG